MQYVYVYVTASASRQSAEPTTETDSICVSQRCIVVTRKETPLPDARKRIRKTRESTYSNTAAVLVYVEYMYSGVYIYEVRSIR